MNMGVVEKYLWNMVRTWIDGIVFSNWMPTTRAAGADGAPYDDDGTP